MAVTVTSISPADLDVNVWDGSPVVVELTDTTDIDLDLITVMVNGVDMTQANGGLWFWNTKAISGGAIVTDTTHVYCVTCLPWRSGEAAAVPVFVLYGLHGPATLSTTTFTTLAAEGFHAQGKANWMALTTSASWRAGQGDGCYHVYDLAVSLVSGRGYWSVIPAMDGSADGYYWVAHTFRMIGGASLIVGEPSRTVGGAALTVRGWARTVGGAALIVQGWVRQYAGAALTVGIPVRTIGGADLIVGIPTTTVGGAALVVYAVNDRNAIDVQVIDSTLYTTLSGLGITWS